VLLLVVYSSLSSPLQVGFVVEPDGLWKGFELFVDLCFWLDLFLNFFTGIDDGPLHTIYDQRCVIQAYMARWFWIDLVSTFPLEVLPLPQSAKDSAFGKVFPLVKTFRLLRLGKIARFMEKASATVLQVWRIGKLGFGLILISHLLGCAFAMLELQFLEDEIKGAVSTYFLEKSPPWTKSYPMKHLYPRVLYTAIGMLLGDPPDVHSGPEAWFCIVALLIGCSVYSVFFGEIGMLVADASQAELDHQRKLDLLNSQMTYWDLPPDIRDKTRMYYQYLWFKFRVNDPYFKDFYATELNTELRVQTTTHMYDFMSKVDLFYCCEPAYLEAVMLVLRPRVYLEDDKIVRLGDPSDGMYFVLHGVVAIVDVNETLKNTLVEHDYFGEISLFSESAKRISTAIAVVASSCYHLLRTDFERVCDESPKDAQKLKKIAVHRFRKIFLTLTTVEQFNILDEDGSHSLTKTELKNTLELISERTYSQKEIDEIFSKMDMDGGGTVDIQEFIKYSKNSNATWLIGNEGETAAAHEEAAAAAIRGGTRPR